MKRALERAGGYGGDFATVLASLRTANRADVVLSTVDTVGIPLMLLNRIGRVRPPLVYVAIGLPERLELLRGERMRRPLRACARVLGCRPRVQRARGRGAAELARVSRSLDAGRVRAVRCRRAGLLALARAGGRRRGVGRSGPPSRSRPVPHGRCRDAESHVSPRHDGRACSGARVAACERRDRDRHPVRGDAAPSSRRRASSRCRCARTATRARRRCCCRRWRSESRSSSRARQAIASGYGLVDGENCRLVQPGDAVGFQRALGDVLRDEWHARALGARARGDRRGAGSPGIGTSTGSSRSCATPPCERSSAAARVARRARSQLRTAARWWLWCSASSWRSSAGSLVGTATRGSSSPSRRGCSTATGSTPTSSRTRSRSSCTRSPGALDRGLEGAGRARCPLVRAGGGVVRASAARAASPDRRGRGGLLPLSARADGVVVRARSLDARRPGGRTARGLVVAPRQLRRVRRGLERRDALQDHCRAARGRTAVRFLVYGAPAGSRLRQAGDRGRRLRRRDRRGRARSWRCAVSSVDSSTSWPTTGSTRTPHGACRAGPAASPRTSPWFASSSSSRALAVVGALLSLVVLAGAAVVGARKGGRRFPAARCCRYRDDARGAR